MSGCQRGDHQFSIADLTAKFQVNNRQLPTIATEARQNSYENDRMTYSPRRLAREFTRKREAPSLAPNQAELLTALVPLTKLIEATKVATSPAAVKNLSDVPTKPKRKRVRVKTERRREQCRNNQARYRNRQRGMVRELEANVRELREEIETLDVQKQSLCYGLHTKQNAWSVVVEYFRLFRYGFLVSMPEGGRGTINQCTNAEFKGQEYFLRAVMTEDVTIGELSGVDALIQQWRCYSYYFGSLQLELGRMEKQPFGAMVATATLGLTITEATLRGVFPHLVGEAGGQEEEAISPLCYRLLGRRIECRCSMRFLWDDSISRMTKLDSKMDLLTPLLRVLGSLQDVNYVLEKALITPTCLLGDKNYSGYAERE